MKPISQNDFIRGLSDEMQKTWQGNVCGLACIASITASTDSSEILNKALALSGWDENVGWKHSVLVELLKEAGCYATPFSYKIFPSRIKKELIKNNIIIASIFSEEGGHLIILKGYNVSADTMEIYDPGTKTTVAGVRTLLWAEFRKIWKRRGIIIQKHDSHL